MWMDNSLLIYGRFKNWYGKTNCDKFSLRKQKHQIVLRSDDILNREHSDDRK